MVSNPDNTLTVLSASVRITQTGINVCGSLGTLPASIRRRYCGLAGSDSDDGAGSRRHRRAGHWRLGAV